jgi:hypothetical protein
MAPGHFTGSSKISTYALAYVLMLLVLLSCWIDQPIC